jgi:ParB family chromosome partitioning protein
LLDAEVLANALKVDMTEWFMLTAGNYFGNISNAVIIDAPHEVKGATASAWTKMKKPELAAFAEKQVEGTGWLPEPLRSHSLHELAEAAE